MSAGDETMSEILEIDGSVLEGGGQILRNTISLSAILGIPVRVKNIRSGRPKPGLAAQHLNGIHLVSAMCEARTRGVERGSTEVEFIPGKLKGGTFQADTQTAGSVCLLLQVALPCALFAPEPVTLELKGGTNVPMAPQTDYMIKVFGPMLRQFGGQFCMETIKKGFYPRGGGYVRVSVTPVRRLLAPRLVERGHLELVTGWAFVAGSLSLGVASHMTQVAKKELRCEAPVHIHAYKETRDTARDSGWGILLMAELSSGCVMGADALGQPGADAGELGRAAAQQLQEALATGACVDSYMQDQLILYMALASGQSSVRVGAVTLHTQTAMHIAQLVANVEFNVIPLSEENVIQCTGRGVFNEHATEEV